MDEDRRLYKKFFSVILLFFFSAQPATMFTCEITVLRDDDGRSNAPSLHRYTLSQALPQKYTKQYKNWAATQASCTYDCLSTL